MSNRLFQSVIHQMKDAVDRTIGVIDESGVVIACSEFVKIGEVRQSIRDELAYTTEMILSGGYTYRPLSGGSKREYVVFVEGEDAEADKIIAAMPTDSYKIALCVEGTQYDSERLAGVISAANDKSGKTGRKKCYIMYRPLPG